MKKVEITIHYANNSKSTSAIFYTENVEKLKEFFEILSDENIFDRTFSTFENISSTEEVEDMKQLAGIKKQTEL
ncbi:MAG: hypothetical protein A2W93_06380 [Bacteroidetes bacterium GWF2_43_63]|nr:MAG: hypothetical protein A2W94_08155 [Bacteroidetes bacterium GWE2_42_42]OFY53247.1 MAG: hypothetical protein A2W93_06380 [Bacteroidetes bacterium GWF2_43_63]HBG71761.1 hypothetical protein [Bacteroidales bacterium]HCB61574.1 hypothetical protein [Bacteroidales bacterium]HCY22786.1 hypothetical protein [Bacteroidales bacterium]